MATGATSSTIGADFSAVFAAISTATPELPGAPFAVGAVAVGPNGAEYVFVKNASASVPTVAGDVMHLSTAFAGTQITTTLGLRGMPVGVAVGAIPVSGYGWVQVRGVCPAIHVLASCAANVRLNTTATAAALDDDGTSTTKQVQGIYLSAARAASEGVAAGWLNFPFVDATL